MKFKLLLLVFSIAFSVSCSAQGFFKPLPKPGAQLKATATATNPLVQNNIRPVVGVTALFSDGTQLAGGAGVGWQHNKWDDPSQSWTTVYSLSAIGFLGSNGTSATFSAGLVLGVLNFLSAGPVYNFNTKKFGLATGVEIHFN